MKRTIIAALLAAIAVVTPFTSVKAEAKAPDNIYAQTFLVYEVDREYDIIYLMTLDGEHEYKFESAEDWHAGDVASALMDSKGTPKVTDDEILNLKYSGYIR